MPVCQYFEKYLLKSLDIRLTHGLIEDGEYDIRKLGQGQGNPDQGQIMKNSYSTVDLLRFLGLFEARPVIFSCHLICNGSSIFLVSLTFRVFLKKK